MECFLKEGTDQDLEDGQGNCVRPGPQMMTLDLCKAFIFGSLDKPVYFFFRITFLCV